jgi:hypothetical protein
MLEMSDELPNDLFPGLDGLRGWLHLVLPFFEDRAERAVARYRWNNSLVRRCSRDCGHCFAELLEEIGWHRAREQVANFAKHRLKFDRLLKQRMDVVENVLMGS